jgi:thiol-disulfide isomerase/thioredoxin
MSPEGAEIGEPSYMSKARLSTGKIVTFLFAAVAVAGLALMLTQNFLGARGSAACQPAAGTFKSFQAAEARPAVPAVPFLGADGKERSLADWNGKGVVLNFWATWCPPCVKEMPALDRLHNILAADGIAVLAISEDREGLPVARKFHDTNKLAALEVMADPKGALLRALKGQGLPTTVLIDARGREVGRVVGTAEWDAPATVGFLKGCLGKQVAGR